MVKLYHLSILYKHASKAVSLCSASDLTSFGYFQRNSIQEFMNFTSQILVERSQPSTRTSVKEQSYMCHVYIRSDRLSAALISDHEYPHRVAHTLLNKILQEFSAAIPAAAWTGEPNSVPFPVVEKYLLDYQNPRNADSITKIQDDLDETKIILHNTLQAVLERGEKLDDLVVKSENLSVQSKAFYKTTYSAFIALIEIILSDLRKIQKHKSCACHEKARKTNACCILL